MCSQGLNGWSSSAEDSNEKNERGPMSQERDHVKVVCGLFLVAEFCMALMDCEGDSSRQKSVTLNGCDI
jgi:hypothetical protein